METKGKHPEVRRKVKELSMLFEISQILDRSMDLRDVVNPVLKSLAERMGMSRGTLTLLNRDTEEIGIEAAYGLSISQKEKGRYKLGEGITGKVVQTGKPAVVPRISENPLFLNKTGARKLLSKKDISFICVPIKLGNEVIGALSADQLFNNTISSEEDVRLLSIIASMIAQAVRLRQSLQEERKRLVEENLRLQNELKDRFCPSNIIGRAKSMHTVYDLIAQISNTDTTVLICGESGTGKELVAQAIHYNSLRSNEPFIKVNCSALPETLIESELFGHEKGAFTGAISMKNGRFELANNGDIFLDEVGDLSPAIQVKLLRVLQEKEFERVGGTTPIKLNIRIIAATNKNLEQLIKEGKFREDLYYRLNVFPIHIPPLRERKTDIILLANFFAEKYSKIHNKPIERISPQALDMLVNYRWPGNVRELENYIERAVLLSRDEVIHVYHLPPSLQPYKLNAKENSTLQAILDNVERELILDTLHSTRGNMAKSSRILGITERLMGLRAKKHAIDIKQFRSHSQV